MQGTMEWFEVRGLYEACLKRQVSEVRAAELLVELLDKTVIRDGQCMAVLNIVTSHPIGDDQNHASPFFNRIMPVERVDRLVFNKIVEWDGESLQKVGAICYEAISEAYTTADQRRSQDSVRSGPEHFRRTEDGTVLQYGAATALLARLLEAAAYRPGDEGDGKVLVPMEMMQAAGAAVPADPVE